MANLDQPAYVNFLVGGMAYCLRIADIKKYPGSYFNAAVKKEWRKKKGGFIEIDRDGELFRYIYDFHFHGELPVTVKPLAGGTLMQIQAEADFFNIPNLVQACEKRLIAQIHKEIDQCSRYKGQADCVYASDEPNDLVNVLGSLYAPFCVIGNGFSHDYSYRRNNEPEEDKNLFKSSTLSKLNIAELLEEAEQSPFGKGTETLIDTSVRNSFEIPASKLNQDTLDSLCFDLKSFAPRMTLEIRPYKLVIYQEGGFFSEHRDSVRGENHIGTLVYILNSVFAGGKLVVRQNDSEKFIYWPNQWIAMYGDCPHRIEPVTSGTRVSLIFDIYNVGVLSEADYFHHVFRIADIPVAEDGWQHAPGAATRASVIIALEKEFTTTDTLVICLTHLYPVCQADPACLKGGDASLYNLLLEADHYELAVIPIAVNREKDRDYLQNSSITANIVDLEFDSASTFEPKTKLPRKQNVRLVIPTCCDAGEILSEKEYIQHVGNQAQNEETQYLTTGLRVVRKVEL